MCVGVRWQPEAQNVALAMAQTVTSWLLVLTTYDVQFAYCIWHVQLSRVGVIAPCRMTHFLYTHHLPSTRLLVVAEGRDVHTDFSPPWCFARTQGFPDLVVLLSTNIGLVQRLRKRCTRQSLGRAIAMVDYQLLTTQCSMTLCYYCGYG